MPNIYNKTTEDYGGLLDVNCGPFVPFHVIVCYGSSIKYIRSLYTHLYILITVSREISRL